MDDKHKFGVVIIISLIVALIASIAADVDGTFRTTIIALITGIIGSIFGLTVNLQELAKTPKVIQIEQKLPDISEVKSKVDELILWKGQIMQMATKVSKTPNGKEKLGLNDLGKSLDLDKL